MTFSDDGRRQIVVIDVYISDGGGCRCRRWRCVFLCGLGFKAGFGPCPLCCVGLLFVLILYLGLCLYLLLVGNKSYLLSQKKKTNINFSEVKSTQALKN